MEHLLPRDINKEAEKAKSDARARKSRKRPTVKDFESGGFPAAAHRLIMLICGADGDYKRQEFLEAVNIVWENEELRKIDPETTKQIIRGQARLVQADPELALKTIRHMAPEPEKRKELLRIASRIAEACGEPTEDEKAFLNRIKKSLAV